jgi:hypothetical protein
VSVAGRMMHGGGFRHAHLVLDEREQGRDDQREARCVDEGGQLVAEALAAPAGHEAEHVPALQRGVDDLPLQRPAWAREQRGRAWAHTSAWRRLEESRGAVRT